MIRSSRFVFPACALLWLILATCGKDSSTNPSGPETPAAPARITITPASNEFDALGQTVQLSAAVFDSNNQRITDATVSWSSSNPDVVAVSAQGVIRAVKNGSARITATVGSVSAFTDVVVSQVGVRVTITPPGAVLTSMGQTRELAVVVHDLNGQIVEGVEVTWTSDNPDVVTVDDNGVITALKNGSAEITATVSGVGPASIPVTVSDPGLDREILVDFYNKLDGPGWINVANWLTEAPLNEWSGILTDEEGRVTTLSLNAVNMRGVIPPEVGDLSKLETLSLLKNHLSGPIPPELGNLSNLIHLDFDENQLSGSVPPELGNLTSLRYLWVKDNVDLSGPLPKEMTRLTDLRILDLRGTSLCVPPDDVFQTWLEGVRTKRGIATCSTP